MDENLVTSKLWIIEGFNWKCVGLDIWQAFKKTQKKQQEEEKKRKKNFCALLHYAAKSPVMH